MNRDLKNDSLKIKMLRTKIYRDNENWIKANGINKEFFEKENVQRIMTYNSNQDVHELRHRILLNKKDSVLSAIEFCEDKYSTDIKSKSFVYNHEDIAGKNLIENKDKMSDNTARLDFIK